MSNETKRQLSSAEDALTQFGRFAPFAVVGVLCLEDGPEPETLRQALDTLQQRQPLLRARIVTQGRRAFFESIPKVPPIPLQLIDRHDDQHWRQVATRALNTTIEDRAGPLLQCAYLRSPSRKGAVELVFTFHHAVMDATSAIPFYDELLSLSSGSVELERPSIPSIMPGAEQLLPPAMAGVKRIGRLLAYVGRQVTDEMNYRRHLGEGRRAPIWPSAQNRILTRTLDEETTRALVRRCRRLRLSMYDALSAAMLLAVKKRLYQDELRPYRMMSFADLRPYLRPPVPESYLGCYIAIMRHTIYLPPSADFWHAVRSIQEVTTRAVRRHDHFSAAMMSKPTMQVMLRFQPSRLATTAVSYIGPTRLRSSYGSIRLKTLHGFISNNRLGPEYTAFASLQDGRLVWDFLYLDTDMDLALAESIADEVNDRLRRAI